MKKWGRRVCALLATLGLSSCAYMQTHKNVEEMGSYYEGHVLNRPNIELVQSDKQWYIGAQPAQFRLHYPIVHDSVFRKTENGPYFQLLKSQNYLEYHPVSDYVADILQHKNGYFSMQGLAEEIRKTPGTWQKLPSGAKVHAILADIPQQSFRIEGYRVPRKKSPAATALGKLDFIVVDVPGTLVYNVAIPVMAPFVFFYEFLKND